MLLGSFPILQVLNCPTQFCMEYAISCNQKQINLAMVMVQFCCKYVEHFKNFISMWGIQVIMYYSTVGNFNGPT